VRLQIAKRRAGEEIFRLRVEKSITRLGGNFSTEKNPDESAVGRTLEAVSAFVD